MRFVLPLSPNPSTSPPRNAEPRLNEAGFVVYLEYC
jgi:hypothetical protein